MQLSKEENARKLIHNGCSMQTKNSVTRDNCLASLGKPHDAESYPHDTIVSPLLTTIKDSYNTAYIFHFILAKKCSIWLEKS